VPDLRDDSTRTFIPFYIWYHFGGIVKRIESPSDLSDFLRNDLPRHYILWELKEGKVSSLKTARPEYTRFFPSFITQLFEDKLLDSLRSTLWRLSHDIMFPSPESVVKFKSCVLDHTEEERARRAEPYVKAYQIITEIQNYSSEHYEVPCIMGLFSELKAENKKALSHYEQSLSIIERDKNIDTSKGNWKSIKDEVQEHIERTKRKLRKTS
jgi:hypothetical protein